MSEHDAPPAVARPSAFERALGVVTRVEAGEGVSALLLTLNVFILMTAYSAIKPVREGLILALASGAEYKSYMGAASAIALLVAVPAYARFADKVPRNRLIVGSTLFFASNLVLFWLGSAVPAVRARLGLAFYLWVGVFNMRVIAQFWSFANDVYRGAGQAAFSRSCVRGDGRCGFAELRRRGAAPRPCRRDAMFS